MQQFFISAFCLPQLDKDDYKSPVEIMGANTDQLLVSQQNIREILNYSFGFLNPMGLWCWAVSFCFMASSVKAM